MAEIDATTGIATAWDPNVDSNVEAILSYGGDIYIGGSFSDIGGVPRNYLAAIDPVTGVPTPWNLNPDDTVRSLQVFDGVLYVGGDFTALGGETRNALAAVNLADGTVTSFDAGIGGCTGNCGLGLAIYGDTMYIAGSFTDIHGQPREQLGAVNLATGTVQSFSADFDGGSNEVYQVSILGSYLYFSGDFSEVLGEERNGAAAFNLETEELTVFDSPTVGKTQMYFRLFTHDNLLFRTAASN